MARNNTGIVVVMYMETVVMTIRLTTTRMIACDS